MSEMKPGKKSKRQKHGKSTKEVKWVEKPHASGTKQPKINRNFPVTTHHSSGTTEGGHDGKEIGPLLTEQQSASRTQITGPSPEGASERTAPSTPEGQRRGQKRAANDDVNNSASKRPRSGTTAIWTVPPPDNFRGFAGKRDVLSNFFPCDLYVYGTLFRSNEHAYQWRKARCLGDDTVAELIRRAPDAGAAKRLARRLSRGAGFDQWLAIRIPAMRQLIRAKARCCRAFADELRRTGDAYIAEVVPGERYWGIGDGTGENVMGQLLMELRGRLDEALRADPDDDGRLADFPVLVVSDARLKNVDCRPSCPGVAFRSVVVSSVDKARGALKTTTTSAIFMAVVLNVLSPRAVSRLPADALVDGLCRLVDEAAERVKFCPVVVQLAVSPAYSRQDDDDDDYDGRAVALNKELRDRLRGKKDVSWHWSRLNATADDCFADDRTLTRRAEQELGRQLGSAVQRRLFGKRY